MKIVNIEKVKYKKNTFKVFFENNYSIAILTDTVVKFDLKIGKELAEKEYKEIVSYDKSKKIMSDALALVALRSYSSNSLQEKLLQKGYDKDKTLDVARKLEELKYINDAEFSKNYAGHLSKRGKGEFVIRAELEKQGIDKSLITEALCEIKSQEEPFEQIVKVMRSKFKNFKWKDKDEVRRIAAFFLRRGFSHENIAKAFREYKNTFID